MTWILIVTEHLQAIGVPSSGEGTVVSLLYLEKKKKVDYHISP